MHALGRWFLPLALTSFLAATPVKVATITLEQLVRDSDVIVVGTVERIAESGQTRGARLRIEQLLAGDPAVEALSFVASSTWMCDITTADLDERVLLFLRFPQGPEDLSETGPGSAADRKALATDLGTGALLFVRHAGRGRMPIHEGSEDRHVHVFGDIVEAKDWKKPCHESSWSYRRPLADMLADVQKLLEDQRKAQDSQPR